MKKKVDPRVEVARDVIALLRAKRIAAVKLAYFMVKLRQKLPKSEAANVGVQKLMAGANVQSCKVCAKGALMVAFAMKHDRAKAHVDKSDDNGKYVVADQSECATPLLGMFSQEQLDTIERAYEGFSVHLTWLLKYSDNDARLRAIMRRIIENGGEFSAGEAP